MLLAENRSVHWKLASGTEGAATIAAEGSGLCVGMQITVHGLSLGALLFLLAAGF
jgi:hypothetical protein